jgi:hypothetical protein
MRSHEIQRVLADLNEHIRELAPERLGDLEGMVAALDAIELVFRDA